MMKTKAIKRLVVRQEISQQNENYLIILSFIKIQLRRVSSFSSGLGKAVRLSLSSSPSHK
jgi:hypothetical protein